MQGKFPFRFCKIHPIRIHVYIMLQNERHAFPISSRRIHKILKDYRIFGFRMVLEVPINYNYTYIRCFIRFHPNQGTRVSVCRGISNRNIINGREAKRVIRSTVDIN